MAGPTTNDFPSGTPFYLDPNQQDLLLAALASNQQDPNAVYPNGEPKHPQPLNTQSPFQYPVDNGFDPALFASPQQSTPANAFGSVVDDSPYVDYLDGDTSFDFDGHNGDLMIGALPGESPNPKADDGAEKRSRPADDAEGADGGRKRREPEEGKQAKKPGRKPLTSEPTTKRKAQNRAAQRAFRERKEKHLKDLETKVSELEKASDAANHENGLLRAQVQRLQMELREYRKRLSLNSTGMNLARNQPLNSGFSTLLGNGSTNFQFDFPKFGGLPGSPMFDNGALAKGTNRPTPISTNKAPSRHDSMGRSLSPRHSNGGSAVNSPITNGQTHSRSNTINGPINVPSSNSSSTGQSRVFQFNSGSSTHSNSPSASSNSHVGLNSSCGTSPEPIHNSPKNPGDALTDGYVCHGDSEGEITFCEKLNMACGNPRNPVPRAMSQSDTRSPVALSAKTPAADVNGIDFFANQNGGQFDPALFGDYRDPQAAIMGDGDFTGGFFNDAFPLADFGSPFHFGDTPAVPKPNPLEDIERIQDGDDEVVPADDPNSMLNCHKIWDKLSTRPEFKDGTVDIDNLCNELRAKARCSESGVVVDTKDVEAALQRLPPKEKK